jgi:hypothetical protein
MLRRGIAFVRSQPVSGKDFVPHAHAGIAIHFGDDGRRGDGVAARVALDERALRHGQVDGHRVDQQKIGRGVQLLDRLAHGQTRGLVDIDGVDGGGVHGGHGPRHGALADALRQHFAPFRFEQFAVVQTAHRAIGREDHGAGHHRSEQAAAADFIHARHGMKAARAQLSFECGLTSEFATRCLGPHGVRRLKCALGGGLLCPSNRAGNTVWRGARGRCVPRRCGPLPWHGWGKYAPRPGRS